MVTDPVVQRTHQRLTRLIAPGSPTNEDEQWYTDVRALRTLLEDPNALRVQAFTSPDLALQKRFITAEEDIPPQEWGETGPVINWQPSRSGFVSPMRRMTSDPRVGIVWEGQRDPVTQAAKLHVIGTVLESQDVAAAVQEVFSVVSQARLRDFGERVPPCLGKASSQLHELIELALAPDALARLYRPPAGGSRPRLTRFSILLAGRRRFQQRRLFYPDDRAFGSAGASEVTVRARGLARRPVSSSGRERVCLGFLEVYREEAMSAWPSSGEAIDAGFRQDI